MRRMPSFLLLALYLGTASTAPAQTRIGGLAAGESPPSRLPISGACPALRSCVIPEGAVPGGMAWDGSHLWIGLYFGSNTLYQIDPLTCTVVHTIPAPDINIGGLAWDGSALWCLPEQTGTIYRLDPTSGAILSHIPAPSFGESDPNPSDIAWDGQFLWHADYGHGRIYKLDPANGNVITSFPSPSSGPSGVEFADGVLTVADFTTDLIYFIDPTIPAVLSSCPSPDSHPWGLASEPSGLWNSGSATSLAYLLGQAPTPAMRPTWGAVKISYR
ncbi:MAG: hypothetical protein ACHQ52_03990 [Candidatus Eisenbacteria bacterium]